MKDSQNLTVFPELTDDHVTTLTVAGNSISALHSDDLSHLHHLTRIDLSHNKLSEVDQCAFCGLWELQSVDLSHNCLTFLRDNTFHNLSSLRSLKLVSNRLQVLGPGSFQGLTHLVILDLRDNQLQELVNDTFRHLQHLANLGLPYNRLSGMEAGAFFGLNSLVYLDMAHNNLELSSSSLPARIFAPFGKLEDLHLEHNARASMGIYPVDVFSDLVSLRRLTIDTFSDMYFGQDFATLRQIKTLDLTKNCWVNTISNKSLEGFRNSTLSELLFGVCPLLRIEKCAFCDLPGLKLLSFENMDYLPIPILESLYGLQYQTMSELNIDGVGMHLPIQSVIDHRVSRYLRNICVSTVRIRRCQIQRITASALTGAPAPLSECIEHLDISSNRLTGDLSALIRMFTSFPRLRTISLQDQKIFSFAKAKCLLNQNYQCKMDMVNNPRHNFSISFPTPENMTYINVSSLFSHLNPLPRNLTFPTAKRLKTLDASYIGLATCRSTFYGLENLETLILEGNICNNFTDTAFDFMPSLTTLSLSTLLLDQDFLAHGAKRVFQPLIQLRFLDLSLNNIIHLDPHMLQTQTRLRELDLSGNRLQGVSVDLQHHPELRTLDLSRNMLTTLTSSEREALDRLGQRHHLSLRLKGNPLVCACFNLDFILWLSLTRVGLDGEGPSATSFTCTTQNGQVTTTERVLAQWQSHWRACVGLQMFNVALSVFLVQILGLIITFLVSRSWTQLHYTWRAIRNLRLQPFRRQHFRRDAYVVYADVDDDVNLACVTLRQNLEEQHDVHLLLRNRDEVGGHVAENIVDHIDNSWKVLVLVTRAFSEGDDWACSFAVAQAQRSINANMPDRVIVIFFEDPARLQAMPALAKLLRMVPEGNVMYIRYGTPADHPVWRDLADLILREPHEAKNRR
ncbi:toll-like receptor 4 [Babylonia areolata]|uniref:toll-like receptor 4 n=1 Tax=Babylonia areolata TaxID=304850 RepID=UPI003FD5B817